MPQITLDSDLSAQPVAFASTTISMIWIGRLADLKDPLSALHLVRRLLDQGLEIHLKMVGAGPLEQTLKEEIKRLALDESVTLLGYLSHVEVNIHLADSDLLLITSRSESYSLVALEAIINGVRVLSTPVGIVPEISAFCNIAMTYSTHLNLSCDVVLEFLRSSVDGSYKTEIASWSTTHFNQTVELLRLLASKGN